MKDISSVESLVIPEGVTVASKARTIVVTGPRGTLTKKVGHIQMDIQVVSFRATMLDVFDTRSPVVGRMRE